MTTFQPEWGDTPDELDHEGILLSQRQRDFLASFEDGVVVELCEQRPKDGAIRIYANGNLHEQSRELWLPWEGYLNQPAVTLDDPDDEVPDAPPS